MTPTYSESQPPPPRLDPAGPIHLIVPLRPGADLEQLRARLTSVPALQQRSVQWHVPGARADIVHLAEINFQAMYEQQQAQAAGQTPANAQ